MSEAARALVLVAHGDHDARVELRSILERASYDVQESSDASSTAELAISSRPDAIVLDGTHRFGVEHLVSSLRQDFRTAFTPIVYLGADPPAGELVGGADDYVLTPVKAGELVARVEVTLRRSATLRGLSPVTGLPGNEVISEEIERRLRAGDDFGCLYVDIDQFKAYNDVYGFTRGDDVIRTLARCVVEALEHHQPSRSFAGHIGGDDFVVLVPSEDAESVAKEIANRFTEDARELYDAADRRRGWIQVTDRRGVSTRVPLCTVSIGVVLSRRGFAGPAQMAQVAAEVKSVAKREPSSAWAVDRRT